MIYTETITISAKLANKINQLTTIVNPDFGEDETITVTANFGNGYEMDIKCCGADDETAWTEAVLFYHGSEVCCSEPSDEFLGEWELKTGSDKYIVNVVIG